MNRQLNREDVERCARLYASNKDAAAAMGVTPGAFSRACIRWGIPTPQQRRRRARECS